MTSMKWLGPTWINVSLDALETNLEQIRSQTKAAICAVVKGDAYGHGAVATAKFYESKQLSYLATSDLFEAVELRQTGIQMPILVLSPCLPEQAVELVKYNLTATVSHEELVQALAKQALTQHKHAKVHIKVDTGMGRVGVSPDCAIQLANQIINTSHLELEGIYTHFAVAYSDHDYTKKQFKQFLYLQEQLKQPVYPKLIWHSANSAAFCTLPASHLDLVRIGTLLYGQSVVKPPPKLDLQSTWTLFTRIIQVKSMKRGESIGYGRTYTTRRASVIGTIPLGYGDGLGVAPNRANHWQHIRTSLSSLLDNPRKVILDGEPYPIVGKIAMGMCCIDLTDHPHALELYGTSVEIPTRRITMNRRIPKVYSTNNKVCLILWQNRFWQPLVKGDQVYLKEISFIRAKEILQRR